MLKKKIFLIDDSAFISQYISMVMTQADYQVFTAASGGKGLKMVREVAPDLILLDIVLPDMDGFDICRILRADSANNLLPIIMLTSKHDEEDKLKGLELGADDYITKPFNDRELLSRVSNTLRRIDRNRYANPLTGLEGNLRIENDICTKLIDGANFSVIYADLDHFKAFNDVYGFAKGDIAIKLTADIITDQVLRYGAPNDFVGHIGGDDFVVITRPELTDDICKGIIETFDARIRDLYSDDHLRTGFIVTADRQGTIMKFPIMSISMAVVDNERRRFESHIQLAEFAAELKKTAKSVPGSSYFKNRC